MIARPKISRNEWKLTEIKVGNFALFSSRSTVTVAVSECSICLQPLGGTAGGLAAALPDCGHKFHRVCILRWAMHGADRADCPNCRKAFHRTDLGQRRPDVELPAGWVAGGDPVYYYNYATGESSWTPPLLVGGANR